MVKLAKPLGKVWEHWQKKGAVVILTILGEQAEQTCWEVEICGGLVMARMEIFTEIFSSFGPNLYTI